MPSYANLNEISKFLISFSNFAEPQAKSNNFRRKCHKICRNCGESQIIAGTQGRQSTICIFHSRVGKFSFQRGRKEPSKPQFGALRTFRTKTSDNCRSSVYFQKFLHFFIKFRGNSARKGRKLLQQAIRQAESDPSPPSSHNSFT